MGSSTAARQRATTARRHQLCSQAAASAGAADMHMQPVSLPTWTGELMRTTVSRPSPSISTRPSPTCRQTSTHSRAGGSRRDWELAQL